MTSKGGSIGWHFNSWLMFSVVGWASGTALAEFSSCHRVCAERPWPLASSHTGEVAWCRGRSSAFIFRCPRDKGRPKTKFVIFAEPLMMRTPWEWASVGGKTSGLFKDSGHMTIPELVEACTNQAVL